jgi:hypothetical protein
MNSFDLIEISTYEPRFPTLPLSQFRAIVDDAVQEMKWEFDGSEDEIDDWASGGWEGRGKLMNRYAMWADHSESKIRRLRAFEKLITAFHARELAVLKEALSTRHAA